MTGTLHRTLLRRPWAVWLAVLIAVFAALAPTVSHALARTYRVASMETDHCSSVGLMPTAANSTGSTDGQGSAAALVHCPLCLHVTDRVALLPVVALPPLLLPDASPPPRVQQVFFFSTYLAHAPPPRGPPGFQSYQRSSA
jgi:hypothetical protein